MFFIYLQTSSVLHLLLFVYAMSGVRYSNQRRNQVYESALHRV